MWDAETAQGSNSICYACTCAPHCRHPAGSNSQLNPPEHHLISIDVSGGRRASCRHVDKATHLKDLALCHVQGSAVARLPHVFVRDARVPPLHPPLQPGAHLRSGKAQPKLFCHAGSAGGALVMASCDAQPNTHTISDRAALRLAQYPVQWHVRGCAQTTRRRTCCKRRATSTHRPATSGCLATKQRDF